LPRPLPRGEPTLPLLKESLSQTEGDSGPKTPRLLPKCLAQGKSTTGLSCLLTTDLNYAKGPPGPAGVRGASHIYVTSAGPNEMAQYSTTATPHSTLANEAHYGHACECKER
jgi:hypothetical protein